MVKPRVKPKREDKKIVDRVDKKKVGRVQYWSNWYVAVVPKKYNSKQYKKRSKGNEGFIHIPISKRFQEKYDDGIYELLASKRKRGYKQKYVVYIGSAHRKDERSLIERIMEHCRGTSSKKDLINRAIGYGYKISVRAKILRGSREEIRERENKLLRKYDYAWNKRLNGRIRKGIPPR